MDVRGGQGSIKSASVSDVPFAGVLRLGHQGSWGHHVPQLNSPLWGALRLWQKNQPESAFLPTHMAEVSVPEF